jgi:MshEN domain
MAQTTKRLGQFLVARGWIDRGGVERALATQGVVGGHLGTSLLELGVISEEQLGRALSELLGVPSAGVDELRNVRDEVIKLIPERLAVRHQAIPLRLLGGQLAVAMVDTGDLAARDELSFASGKRIAVHVAPEARILEALDRFYGSECPPRITRLIDRLNRARYLWAGEEGQAGAAGGLGDPAVELFPVSPEILPPPSLGPERAADAEGAPLSDAEAAARLAAACERDEIGRIVVSFLGQNYTHVALLAVLSDRVTGWMGAGDGFRPKRLAALVVPLGQPSVFLNLREGSAFHLGPLAPMPAHRQLAECWGGELAADSLVAPIRIGDRMVAAIYADRAPESLGGVDLDQIQHLSAQAAAALERCIVLKKQRQTSSRRR